MTCSVTVIFSDVKSETADESTVQVKIVNTFSTTTFDLRPSLPAATWSKLSIACSDPTLSASATGGIVDIEVHEGTVKFTHFASSKTEVNAMCCARAFANAADTINKQAFVRSCAIVGDITRANPFPEFVGKRRGKGQTAYDSAKMVYRMLHNEQCVATILERTDGTSKPATAGVMCALTEYTRKSPREVRDLIKHYKRMIADGLIG